MPAAIRTRPIGAPDQPLGALIVFDTGARECDAQALDHAPKLARVAIEHNRFYDQLNFQANHDSLTGLPNRALFCTSRHGSIVRCPKYKLPRRHPPDRSGSLQTGERRHGGTRRGSDLTDVADRLHRVLRPTDIVARIGGDEFNVLLTDISSEAEAEAVAERLRVAMRQPRTGTNSAI